MTWRPEGTTSVLETEESRLEWIQRNFRKLSQWSTRWVQQGYGGMYVAQTIVLPTPLVLTTTFQKLTYFDTLCSDSPVGVQNDLPNSRIRIVEGGVWNYQFSAHGKITSFSANSAQAIEFASRNETTGIFDTFGFSPIPRYANIFDFSVEQLRHVGRAPGDWFSLWVRIPVAAPAVSILEIDELEISSYRVGQSGTDSTLVRGGILS